MPTPTSSSARSTRQPKRTRPRPYRAERCRAGSRQEGSASGNHRVRSSDLTAQRNNFKYTIKPSLPEVVPLLLPGSWLVAIGALNVFCGISVIAGSHIFTPSASWLVGDARPWGWLMLLVGLIQLGAGPAVWLRRWWAIWVGLLSASAHLVFAIMFLQDYLGWALLLIALDLTVLVCLLAGSEGSRRARPSYG